MKNLIFLFSVLILFSSCDNSTMIIDQKTQTQLLPQPKKLVLQQQSLVLSENSKIFSSNMELEKLLLLFQKELFQVTQLELGIDNKVSFNSDIIFELDEQLEKESYQIDVLETVLVRGGSYQALCMGKNTLLQLIDTENNLLKFPMVNISDQADASYRGLMLDLARQWHSIETIKKTIDLAAFYKSNYLHLHFSDYQSYTLPSDAFPKLSTEGKTYKKEELEELERYSQERGITIIPEIDIPGHSSPFVEKYPEIFAIEDVKENPWIIHMGKEEVYEALEKVIVEICDIFPSTPYFHIGGDEAIFYMVMEDSEANKYMKANHLEEDVHELYRHFLVRMNEIVKKQDKQMCVWEGFTRAGQVKIPKDIIVFEFETNRYLPQDLIEDGYTVVNTSWKPLYVVNRKKWSPETIYNWNLWRWENWFPKAPSFEPIQLEETPLIIGAQMCAWEQAGQSEIPSLRRRLPVMNERIWNTKAIQSYDEFKSKLDHCDDILSLLIEDTRQDELLEGHEFSAEME